MNPVNPVRTMGILGAGQLGQMLALAGVPLGLQFRFYDPAPDSPASRIAPQTVGEYDDWGKLAAWADGLDVITYEFENVPLATARFLAARSPLFPPPPALEAAQDRIAEKQFFHNLEIAVPPFAAVSTREQLEGAVQAIGLPAVLKTRRMGYDGKGQTVLREPGDLEAAWNALGSTPLILEGFVPFQRELSLIAVRGQDGDVRFYPLFENHHRDGILRRSFAPAPNLTAELQTQAEAAARLVLEKLHYVGVLTIEFFERDGRLVVNEMAPRVHNSGHGTIEGAITSQFENHVRAVAGLPLGDTGLRGPFVLLNLIGTLPDTRVVLQVPGAHLHLYGKEERPGRKLGHITVTSLQFAEIAELLDT